MGQVKNSSTTFSIWYEPFGMLSVTVLFGHLTNYEAGFEFRNRQYSEGVNKTATKYQNIMMQALVVKDALRRCQMNKPQLDLFIHENGAWYLPDTNLDLSLAEPSTQDDESRYSSNKEEIYEDVEDAESWENLSTDSTKTAKEGIAVSKEVKCSIC